MTYDLGNSDTSQMIQRLIDENPVVLFMKGTPELPACGFSSFVVQALNHLKIHFIGINVLEDDHLRQGIKDFSQWPTIPQLYIHKEFIGGADILRDMLKSGDFYNTLDRAQISYTK